MTSPTTKPAAEGAVLFPGSFDPFTIGHADLVRRALHLFGHVVIAVGVNAQKGGWMTADQRVSALEALYEDEPCVSVMRYSGLTVDCARHVGATAILRGVRSVKDYDYEQQMADVNRRLSGIDTVLLVADSTLAAVSSSLVRELAHFGHDVSPYLPEGYTPVGDAKSPSCGE